MKVLLPALKVAFLQGTYVLKVHTPTVQGPMVSAARRPAHTPGWTAATTRRSPVGDAPVSGWVVDRSGEMPNG
ncbi:hypothetical protein GCM10009835_38070 [Planosporangium flavigriseum]|uniref:Uncharacterized protein n=1 Tax=Planosporangium flavigriseum TaxID=373681 RepID=A0A8J3LIZ0_9ACTN|nr:hypothetical protein Pfl04_25270 [Planosporangium flavigriseum]